LDGVEVSVGVIQINEITTVVGITEIVSETEFFDYAAKYEGKSKEITPARIDETATKKVEEVAQKVYNLLGMKGFSRAEYILVNGEPFFIEINTNPGLSPQSILPQQVAYAQLKMSDLFDSEIAFAMKRQLIWDNF
jgi:D-alanine-D-alanine ligase